jgi:hypothetical protein
MSEQHRMNDAIAPQPAEGSAHPLPLEAARGSDRGLGNLTTWTVRLPVRAERITVRKPVVLREEVLIHAAPAERSVLVESETRHERLRLKVAGEVRAVAEKARPRAPGGRGRTQQQR